MKKFEKKDLLLLIPIGILLIIQLPNLPLPYFWDEAWSYITGIKAMADAGPSLLPGALPIDYCKGHPQLFFFVNSLWMNLFSSSIVMMRVLSLLVSIGVIITSYVGLKRMINWEAGIFASLLISVQSMFLAQSILVLPEMLMTLLFIISFFFFLENKYLGYAISSTLMVFTKETSIIFCIVFGVFYLASLICKSNREKFKITHILAFVTPALVYALFLLLHYLKFGIIFYGEHLNYITFDWSIILDRNSRAYTSIFSKDGRLLILISTIASFIVLLFHKQKKTKLLVLGILSTLTFLAFSVFNYYTLRYGLVAIVIFIVIFASILGQLKLNIYVKGGITLALACVCLFYSMTHKENCDVDLGYIETIKVHQEMVKYCEENIAYDEPVAVSFNMIFNLRDNNIGYLKGEKEFSKVMDWKNYLEAKYFIHESTFGNEASVEYAKNNFKLIKTFANKHAWGYIYENPYYKELATK